MQPKVGNASAAQPAQPAAASSSVGSAEQPATSLRGTEPPASPRHLKIIRRMNSAATAEHGAEQPAVVRGSATEWTIPASLDQVEMPKHKQMHTRPMPLPFTINAWIMRK